MVLSIEARGYAQAESGGLSVNTYHPLCDFLWPRATKKIPPEPPRSYGVRWSLSLSNSHPILVGGQPCGHMDSGAGSTGNVIQAGTGYSV